MLLPTAILYIAHKRKTIHATCCLSLYCCCTMAVLVAKPRTSSAVRTYFEFEPTDNGKVRNEELTICRLCAKKVSTKAQNTSNLFSHLRNHHPTEYNIAKK